MTVETVQPSNTKGHFCSQPKQHHPGGVTPHSPTSFTGNLCDLQSTCYINDFSSSQASTAVDPSLTSRATAMWMFWKVEHLRNTWDWSIIPQSLQCINLVSGKWRSDCSQANFRVCEYYIFTHFCYQLILFFLKACVLNMSSGYENRNRVGLNLLTTDHNQPIPIKA